jgi:RecA-family ATPase
MSREWKRPWGGLDRWTTADLQQVRDAFRAETGPAPASWEAAIAQACSGAGDPLYAAGVAEYMAHVAWRQGGGRWGAQWLEYPAEGMPGELEPPHVLIDKARAVKGVAVNSVAAQVWRKPPEANGLQAMDWVALAGQSAPERPWIVPGWIPSRAVTLLAGSGGTGKSLLVQQWLTAIATGEPFLGMVPAEPVPVLYVNCEDDSDELWRRQEDICSAIGVDMLHLRAAGFHVLPRMGCANGLGSFDELGKFRPGELLQDIRAYAVANGVRQVALDNLAHLFPGKEIDRAQVTAFCAALATLALEIDGSVLLVGHPAKAEGSTFSGSTAWEAAVRQRLYLSREQDGDGKEIETSDIRSLTIGKANYTGKGQEVELLWRAGAFHLAERGDTPAGDSVAEAAFLQCLDACTAQRRNVSDKPSRAYAPKVFAGMAAGKKTGQKGLERAMERLFDRGVILANSELWRDDRNRRPVFGIARADLLSGAQTPAQTPAQTVAQTRADYVREPAPQHPPYTTYMDGGPLEPPPSDVSGDGYNWGSDDD